MIITNRQEYDLIWKKVYDKLKFKPSSQYRGHSMESDPPFQIDGSFEVYGIENMSDEQIDAMQETVRQIFAKTAKDGKRMYALDWQHNAFLFDPKNADDQKSVWIKDYRLSGGGYDVYFPSFYPDGDYYFFIDEDFEFGYLGHPWRQEIWVFGDKLINEFNKIYKDLGWERL